MDNQQRALKILKQSRALLTKRLVDHIIESGEGILDDAAGSSYMDEIEAISERVGRQLNSVNMMISNLPAIQPENAPPSSSSAQAQAPSAQTDRNSAPRPANFAMFGQQIAANDIEGAGRTLSELFQVDPNRGLQCAQAFRDQLNEDPTIVQKAMDLRTQLSAGEDNEAMMALWDCFRLEGIDALTVVQTLKARLTAV